MKQLGPSIGFTADLTGQVWSGAASMPLKHCLGFLSYSPKKRTKANVVSELWTEGRNRSGYDGTGQDMGAKQVSDSGSFSTLFQQHWYYIRHVMPQPHPLACSATSPMTIRSHYSPLMTWLNSRCRISISVSALISYYLLRVPLYSHIQYLSSSRLTSLSMIPSYSSFSKWQDFIFFHS